MPFSVTSGQNSQSSVESSLVNSEKTELQSSVDKDASTENTKNSQVKHRAAPYCASLKGKITQVNVCLLYSGQD